MASKGIYDNVLTDFIYETAKTGIAAFAGGGQTNATPLTAQTNRVDTVTTRGDSVRLPASVAGLEVTVINNTNNGMQVFGAGADTINGVATGTGIYQPPNSVDTYWCALVGAWHAEVGFGYSGGLGTESSQDSITAFAGGGQASATAITTQTARIATVTTAGDSVKLPASAPGLELIIINHGVSPMQVYGAGTDTINDVATATGVSQMQNSTVIYTCVTAGSWYTEGLASGFSNGFPTSSSTNGITAFAGGGQASGTLLQSVINRVTTVVTAADSIRLPIAVAGMQITVTSTSFRPLCRCAG